MSSIKAWLLSNQSSNSTTADKISRPTFKRTTDSAESLTNQKKRKSGFDNAWTKDNPWLQSANDSGMSCTLCIKHKVKTRSDSGIWTTKPCTSVTEQAVKRHAKSQMHLDAMSMEKHSLSTNLQDALGLAVSLERKAFIGALRCLHWLCKREIAHTTNYKELLGLVKELGCDFPSHLNKGGNASYTSMRTVLEMVGSIGHVIRSDKLQQLQKSPYFSLLIDETTDVSVLKQLIIYGRYMSSNDQVTTTYLGLLDVVDGRAATITSAIVDFMQVHEIDIQKMVGLGSDGAAVMVGKNNGVIAQLKQKNKQIQSIHCVAHRLALAAGQAANDVTFMPKFKATLCQLFYFFQNSPVRTAGLKAIQALLEEPRLKLVKAIDVRWLSHDRAVAVLRQNINSIIASLGRESEERHDATARGLVMIVDSFYFVAAILMCSDILPCLASLSRVFQTHNVDLAIIQTAVQATIASLEKLRGGKGDHFRGIEGYIGTMTGSSVKYMETERDKFVQNVHDKFLTNIINNLEERFADCGTLAHFSVVFDPARLEKDQGIYLDEEQLASLQALGSEFSVDFNELKVQWKVLREIMFENKHNLTFQTNLQATTSKYKELLPHMALLAIIALVLPVSTADCERGFSCLKRIKTPCRNRLGEESLDNLIHISLNDNEMDFERVAQHWAKQKPRRINLV